MDNQADFNEYSILDKKKKRYGSVILLALIVVAAFLFFKTDLFSRKIDVSGDPSMLKKAANFLSFGYLSSKENDEFPKKYIMPKKESDRLDILVLGMRGADDPDKDAGALLTDTILVFSYDKTTKKSSLVSIPRDLYVIINKNVGFVKGWKNLRGFKPHAFYTLTHFIQ